MKLTKLSPAPGGLERRLMPAPVSMNAGTASQLIPGVRPTLDGEELPDMTDAHENRIERARPSRAVAIATILVVGLLSLAIPPSHPRPRLSSLELALEASVVPLLAVALGSAFVAASLHPSRHARVIHALVCSSLGLLNLAATFAERFGVDAVGVGVTSVPSIILVVALLAPVSHKKGGTAG